MLRDDLPRFIIDPNFKWIYCPYCDYSPTFRKHHLNGVKPEYKRVWTCVCGTISRKKKLGEAIDREPWYIKRKWIEYYF